jgi:serine/threonine protein phosphatase 1
VLRLRPWLARALGQGGAARSGRNPGAGWLDASARPAVIYAIGDVHGCLDELRRLEALITADAAAVAGEKWLVHLGDYIDRGPASAGVLDHLLAPPPRGFRRLGLKGNPEEMLLDALADPTMLSHWLANGGDATLASYGLGLGTIEGLRQSRGRRQLLEAHLPEEHLALMRELPVGLSVPGFVFVHAGLRPGVPITDQDEADLLWIRGEFLDSGYAFGPVVVHGHTPAGEPFLSDTRIGIDTGCFMSGRLTALRVDADGKTGILQT